MKVIIPFPTLTFVIKKYSLGIKARIDYKGYITNIGAHVSLQRPFIGGLFILPPKCLFCPRRVNNAKRESIILPYYSGDEGEYVSTGISLRSVHPDCKSRYEDFLKSEILKTVNKLGVLK